MKYSNERSRFLFAWLIFGLLSMGALQAQIYVSSVGGFINQYNASGQGSLFATVQGGGQFPFGVAIDSSGDVFVANYMGNNIQEFLPNGTGSIFATASSGLSSPRGLAFDTAGNLYVANYNNTIEKFNQSGVGTIFASTGSNPVTELTFDAQGNLYGANYGNNTVMKFAPDGTSSIFASASSGLSGPRDMAFDSFGNMYVTNYDADTVLKFSPDGSTHSTFFTGTSDYFSPFGIAIDNANDVYVTFDASQNVVELSPSGNIITPLSPTLYEPLGIAIKNPLITPEPSALELLIVGGGLLAWRKKAATLASPQRSSS